MEDTMDLIKRAALWLVADPERAAALVLAVLVATWKALPAPLRAKIEQSHPRAVGVVRTVVAIAPDVIGAARTAVWQVVRGVPREQSNVTVTLGSLVTPPSEQSGGAK
jgi:hypothetical protein